ncbi:MAG: hypothetical protein J5858_00875 [Lentisphaeria bacterium]|nr:hypothetical protein [Lentisphaeria bacterium]
MEINYKHPEFGVWHLAETPIKVIPYGALVKWFDRVIQFGFHLGGGEIAWRDGLISAENLDTDPGLPWKRKTCVLAQDSRAVVFWQQPLRSRMQTGLYATRQDFISACLGDDLATWGDFPVWIFDRFGKCFLHPVAGDAVYENQSAESEFLPNFGRKPFTMTENVAPLALYSSDTTNHTGGEIMETLEMRLRHFQKHNKGNGTLEALTFWEEKARIQLLTNYRFDLHEIYKEFMKISFEEQMFRLNVFGKPDYDTSRYSPTQWRFVCCYEEIVERTRAVHSSIRDFAVNDLELSRLLKPFPAFTINGTIWQENQEDSAVLKSPLLRKNKLSSYILISCCKSLMPLCKYILPCGELDSQIEAMLFVLYRRDMEKYQDDTRNDGF